MSNFIGVYENLASDEYCTAMIETLEDLLKNNSDNDCGEVIHNGVANRKDYSRYFERDSIELAQQTHIILNNALKNYKENYPSIGMIDYYSNVVKVQKTPPKGGFHTWHAEQGPDVSTSTRCLVWMIYLNDTEEGEGTTEFLEQGLKLQPKRGTVVLFPASWTHTHRGNPVYKDNKYIATGWYYLT